MARNVYGLDLGSYDIKVYDKKKDTIWKEKNVIAFKDNRDRDIFAVGDDAFSMYGKAPSNIEITFPMEAGVISRFNDMQFLLQNLLKRGRQFSRGSEYVIAVPTDVTEVEKKAFFDLVIHSTAKAKEVNIVERSIADAVGLNLDIQNTKGIMIANFGGETTELSVLAGGGMVLKSRLFDRTADGRSTSKKFQCIYGRFRFYIIGGRKRSDHRCTDAKAYFYYACPCGNEGSSA